MLRKRTDTPELRAYWQFVEETAAEVATWPAWKRGEKETDESVHHNRLPVGREDSQGINREHIPDNSEPR
jgi:hypothetical protein